MRIRFARICDLSPCACHVSPEAPLRHSDRTVVDAVLVFGDHCFVHLSTTMSLMTLTGFACLGFAGNGSIFELGLHGSGLKDP